MDALTDLNVQASGFSDKTLSVHLLLAEDQLMGKIAAKRGINETEILVNPLNKYPREAFISSPQPPPKPCPHSNPHILT